MRRVILVEVDTEPINDNPWDLEESLLHLNGKVLGTISHGDVDAAWRKVRQLAREIAQHDSHGNIEHSAFKAQSFFRDMFSRTYWDTFMIGHNPQSERLVALRGRK